MAQYLKFKCVYCGQSMECDPAHSGRQIKCPSCDHKMVIPQDPNHKLAGGKSPKDDTWMTDVPSPDVSTPTRYKAPPKNLPEK